MNEMTEEMLVAHMKLGDRYAFEQLYNKYRASVYRTACLISGNTQDGEDITQETFVKAFLHCRELKANTAFRYWLFKILNRTAWQLLNSKKTELPDEHILDKADAHGTLLTEDFLLQREQQNEVWQAVMKLNYKLRLIVVLYYYNELPTKQIAKITGCYEGTVKSRLFTARKRLKQLLPEDSQQHDI
ncbi:MAG: RNA polymerase sigma factor [Lachnospiraceae bacterium]|nr:RNA polymerase sigma factor [Lachnospiraceae bacterium]MBO5146204.1 RNA polymerase sigma factor [Lachnospiraceae bacterium]